MKPLLSLVVLIWSAANASTNLPFGEYYPHTRWIDQETHSVQIDAFPHRLVISRKGHSAIIIEGCWRGRAFLRDCKIDFFGVAHEGIDAALHGDKRFERFSFRRIRPDPA
jgi:hypothetical protein